MARKELTVTPKKSGRTELFDEGAKKIYLDTLREKGTVRAACEAAGTSRQTLMRHRDEYPEFAEAEFQARKDYCDALEEEIRRRGVDGVEEDVFDKDGNRVGSRVKYSDTLLIFHAKRHIPEYRDTPIVIDNRTTVLNVPDRLAKHLDTRREMLGEVAVQEYKPTGDGNALDRHTRVKPWP